MSLLLSAMNLAEDSKWKIQRHNAYGIKYKPYKWNYMFELTLNTKEWSIFLWNKSHVSTVAAKTSKLTVMWLAVSILCEVFDKLFRLIFYALLFHHTAHLTISYLCCFPSHIRILWVNIEECLCDTSQLFRVSSDGNRVHFLFACVCLLSSICLSNKMHCIKSTYKVRSKWQAMNLATLYSKPKPHLPNMNH